MPTDERQQMAATSSARDLLIVAPPGCGKTELLALRARQLIGRLGPHQRVLALTFTNRAKANLTERLQNVLGAQQFRRYVSVRNFHGHAGEIVLSHGRTLGIRVDELTMPSTKTLKTALAQPLPDILPTETPPAPLPTCWRP
jgi:DNA helicase II / ATP-dependent DNA helicase PcrA